MVGDAANTKGGALVVAQNHGQIGVQRRANFADEQGLAVFDAENEMHDYLGEGLRHGGMAVVMVVTVMVTMVTVVVMMMMAMVTRAFSPLWVGNTWNLWRCHRLL